MSQEAPLRLYCHVCDAIKRHIPVDKDWWMCARCGHINEFKPENIAHGQPDTSIEAPEGALTAATVTSSSVEIQQPKPKKWTCKKGHLWEGEEFTVSLSIPGLVQALITTDPLCPFCMIERLNETCRALQLPE